MRVRIPRLRGRAVARPLLLLAAVALIAAATPADLQAATNVYRVTNLADLVNLPFFCGGTSYYGSNSSQQNARGFRWADNIPAGSTVTNVRIEFNMGVDCHSTNTNHQGQLNNNAPFGSFNSISWCSCSQRTNMYTLNTAAGYAVGGVNLFTWTAPFTTPMGLVQVVFPGDSSPAWARITVDYTAGQPPPPGQCASQTSVDRLESKLDDGTRWVSDAELATSQTNQTNTINATFTASQTTQTNTLNTAISRLESKLDDGSRWVNDAEFNSSQSSQTNTIVGEINFNEAKIDLLEAKADALESKLDDQAAQQSAFEESVHRMEIEKALLAIDRISYFFLPQSFGGVLERVRDVVADVIAKNIAAGYDVGNAPTNLANGDASYAQGQWRNAFDSYRQAYRNAAVGQ